MRLTVNIKTLPAKTFRKAVKYAETVVAEQALKDTDPFVPALTGTFSKLAHTVGNEIIYTGDQAQYLYHGKVMVDQDNRHAVFYEGKGWRHRKGAILHATDKNLVFTTDMHPQAQSHWMEASEAKNGDKWAEVAERAIAKAIK